MMKGRHFWPAALLAAMLAVPARAAEADRKALVEGVREIAAPGVPGPLSLIGEQAFAVATGKVGRDTQAPVVAAGRLGKGRVVVFGHTGYFDVASLETADTGRLVQNAVRWAAGRRRTTAQDIRVAVVRAKGLVEYLRKHQVTVEELTSAKLLGRLDVDVLAVGSHELSEEAARTAVADFVRAGNGLLVTGLGWGWLQLNAGKDLVEDHPGNRLLREAGIAWADGTLGRTSEHGFSVEAAPLTHLHGVEALDALAANRHGGQELSKGELSQAGASMTLALRSFPVEGHPVFAQCKKFESSLGQAVVPSPRHRVTESMPLERAVLAAQLIEAQRSPPERVRAHPAAAIFPGSVPTDAPRVTRSASIDTSIPGWHSTGLYAPAGEVIEVELPTTLAAKTLHLRIGCHSDKLWDKDVWRRCPETVLRQPLAAGTTRAASPFGGLIYVEVPAKGPGGRLTLTIRRAVEAPLFVLGETSGEAWRQSIRHRPAPWAELATDRVIVTVPADAIRALDDPEPVLRVWNDILDACAVLAGRPTGRERPERYVADEQISAGYMHSGYPIMTHLDAAAPMVSREKLLAGQWGLFHEMGHNHQSGDWTFDGAGEVTVNLFSLYICETVCKLPVGGGHPAVLAGQRRREAYRKYVAGGRDFAAWKADPFLALTMYVQLREAFGWEAYQRVLVEYRRLPASERPQSDQQKRDQWMVRFSRAVCKDLGPFFEAWGVPTTPAVRQSLADLPAWWPDDFPRDADVQNDR